MATFPCHEYTNGAGYVASGMLQVNEVRDAGARFWGLGPSWFVWYMCPHKHCPPPQEWLKPSFLSATRYLLREGSLGMDKKSGGERVLSGLSMSQQY